MSENKRIEDIISAEGMYVTTTVGVSMYPMLKNRRDTVVVLPKSGRLGKYDVPLCRIGRNYVLHRVIKVLPDGGYITRGDNCVTTETVAEDDVIGVLDRFWRKDREVSVTSAKYKAYARFYVWINPFIRGYRRGKCALAGICRRISGKKKRKDG